MLLLLHGLHASEVPTAAVAAFVDTLNPLLRMSLCLLLLLSEMVFQRAQVHKQVMCLRILHASGT